MNAPLGRHWDEVYVEKAAAQTSWFRAHLDESLRLIDALDLGVDAPLLDAGGGRSSLVDDLLSRGFRDISVNDLSAAALRESRDRLGPRGDGVHWITGDVTGVEWPAAQFALWHDRAVFHFLTTAAERERYVAAAARAVRPGGHAIVATFAPDGPERCSGLPVQRWSADELAAAFASSFDRVAEASEMHRTPAGREQPFTYVLLRRRGQHAPCDPSAPAVRHGAG